MKPDDYLKEILKQQTLKSGSDEVRALKEHRDAVAKLLRQGFENSSPTIRYGGSKAKGTMNLDNYDLDIICYFENEDTEAGETLADIFANSISVLEKEYLVEPKTSALRIRSKGADSFNKDFHIDVVPGRFTGEDKSDAFIHMQGREKSRQKTNLQVHIDHIKNSGVVDTIRLAKLWNGREGLSVKTFVLELLVVKSLKGKTESDLGLAECLERFWTYVRDHRNSLCVEDPANPSGNDLSLYIDGVRHRLCNAAEIGLEYIESDSWESLFGSVEHASKYSRIEVLNRTVEAQTNAPKPWIKEDYPGI